MFDKVTTTMGLRETWYFGLQCVKAGQMWMIDEKRIVDQVYIDDGNKPVQLNLLVKFYPLDVNDLIQDITKHLFFLQVKDQILSRIIFAPAEVCVMLASYALQAKVMHIFFKGAGRGGVFSSRLSKLILLVFVVEESHSYPGLFTESKISILA